MIIRTLPRLIWLQKLTQPVIKRCLSQGTARYSPTLFMGKNDTASRAQGKKISAFKKPVQSFYADWKELEKEVDWNGETINLSFTKGTNLLHAPNFWLRDNCPCPMCKNPDTMQRAVDTFSIPNDIIPDQVIARQDGLEVIWANDGHKSVYSWEWLLIHMVPPSGRVAAEKSLKIDQNPRPKFWDATVNPPSVHYDEIMSSDSGVGIWTSNIRRWGFCYVDGCAVSPGATEKLLERMAFIRITHYGGFYDFTSDLTMKDTAYTSQALGAHTDTTYFTDPAGLQMFHLLSHTEGTGGESLLVDGFHAASILKKESPRDYQILAHYPIPWHASGNEGVTITPAQNFPVLGLDRSRDRADSLLQVRWNNDDRGTVPMKLMGTRDNTWDDGLKWYAAARKWNEILQRKEMQYWSQLEPGRPVIFDNWRVLHGRAVFTGKRRMCGGYINRDDFISRWRNTNYSREDVIEMVV